MNVVVLGRFQSSKVNFSEFSWVQNSVLDSRIENVIVWRLVKEVNRRFSALWNDVVSQLLHVALHGDNVDADIQGLR